MPNKKIEDNLLARQISDNNLIAFEALYQRYKKKLYFFSLQYLGNEADAEDVVQAVFINLWEHRSTLDETRSIKSYIYKSATNNIINILKKRAIREKYIMNEMVIADLYSDQAYNQIYYQDLKRSINEILSKLPPQQQKIFHLSRFMGLSYKEIAEELGLSVRTVENQCYRAMKVIKKNL